MDEEIWSPSEPTPIAPHFPGGKGELHDVSSPGWHGLPSSEFPLANFSVHRMLTKTQGAGFNPPVTHMMIDPLLLGAGEGFHQPPMHTPMPRGEELMFAMNEMHLVPDSRTPVSVPPDFASMGYPIPFSAIRQSSPHSYGSGDTGSPQSGVSAASSHPGILPCKYPVLKPLIPHLGSIMTVPVACDLLEYYFQSSSSVFMEPVSPYILGTVFRKRSFLRQHKPRKCSPALLASMLWIAAQTSEASYLTSSPSARGAVCQKLWKLTIDLLKPLVHSPSSHGFAQGSGGMVSPAAHDAFGVDRVMGQFDTRMDAGMPPTSTLDDVATYLNLGIVTSASEYKAASLRWWNAAWSLARELKLGRELPQDQGRDRDSNTAENEAEVGMSDCSNSGAHIPAGTPTAALIEEMKEERRRLWWLLYMIDVSTAVTSGYRPSLSSLLTKSAETPRPVLQPPASDARQRMRGPLPAST